jgi:DNA polymerase sigma
LNEEDSRQTLGSLLLGFLNYFGKKFISEEKGISFLYGKDCTFPKVELYCWNPLIGVDRF